MFGDTLFLIYIGDVHLISCNYEAKVNYVCIFVTILTAALFVTSIGPSSVTDLVN